MGGPAMCDGKAQSCTDNFQFCDITVDNIKYYSSEQFYQALKMKKKEDLKKIAQMTPKNKETQWDYGMRVWQKGQLHPRIQDCDKVKVNLMYRANHAKFDQNPKIKEDLISLKGDIKFSGESEKFWNEWNCIILKRLREEFRGEQGDQKVIQDLTKQMYELTGQSVDKYF